MNEIDYLIEKGIFYYEGKTLCINVDAYAEWMGCTIEQAKQHIAKLCHESKVTFTLEDLSLN